MKIIRAKSAGFCLGVSLALQKLDRVLQDNNSENPKGRLAVLGAIIHNPLVMEHYERLGVVCLHDPEEVAKGDTVVIRAHGVPREVEEAIRKRGAVVIDATCPKVKKAQVAIAKARSRGGTMLLFGEAEHPEVKGLVSYADHDAYVFGTLEEVAKLDISPNKKYFLAAQTTQDRKTFLLVQDAIQEQLTYKLPVLSTICDATKQRQDEVLHLAESVDAMVVVGGKNSGNTTRLAQISQNSGVPTQHVEAATELDLEALGNARLIGLTAGASTPEEHIADVQRVLQAYADGSMKANDK